MRHLIADFDAGQKSSSRRSPWSPFLDSFRVADKPGLETLTTLGTKTRSGQGYVMRLCRTRPKEVSECTWERFLLMMSSTRIPSTVNASAMRERWQRQAARPNWTSRFALLVPLVETGATRPAPRFRRLGSTVAYYA